MYVIFNYNYWLYIFKKAKNLDSNISFKNI